MSDGSVTSNIYVEQTRTVTCIMTREWLCSAPEPSQVCIRIVSSSKKRYQASIVHIYAMVYNKDSAGWTHQRFEGGGGPEWLIAAEAPRLFHNSTQAHLDLYQRKRYYLF
jgi:hypothetical protein